MKIIKFKFYRSGIALLLFLFTIQGWAQFDTLARDDEPVIMTADQFAIFNDIAFDQLFLYAYEQSTDSWSQIPFQFDDVDDQERYFAENNQILDDHDEVVFMARDAGDLSPVSSWIADIDSRNYNRYQIQITDGTDPSSSAWVYLYRSQTLTYSADDLVSYNGTTNQITTDNYQLGFNAFGTLNDLMVTATGGGNGADIIDREKLRSDGQYNSYAYTFTEEDMTLENTNTKDGTVRVIREIDVSFSLFDAEAEKDITERYYDRMSVTGGSYGRLYTNYGITYLRQSLDLNSNANGMTFYATNNSGSGNTIDGSNDAVDTSLPVPGTPVWSMVTGAPASIVQLVNLPNLGTDQSLYYHDDNISHNSGDGMPETGDNAPNYESWGDLGISFSSSSPMSGLYEIGYTRFFMPANQSVNDAQQLLTYYENPLITQAILLDPYPVELSSFRGQALNNSIELQWITRSETENYGYYIYRSEQKDGRYERITIKVIPGAGDSDSEHTYRFVDYNVEPGKTYYYKLVDIDFTGKMTFHDPIEVEYAVPGTYELKQNYPNPFNPTTTIDFSIEKEGYATIEIYNLNGKKINTLLAENVLSGNHSIAWNGTDDHGNLAPSGVYFCILKINQFQKSIKMTLLK